MENPEEERLVGMRVIVESVPCGTHFHIKMVCLECGFIYVSDFPIVRELDEQERRDAGEIFAGVHRETCEAEHPVITKEEIAEREAAGTYVKVIDEEKLRADEEKASSEAHRKMRKAIFN